MAFGADDLLIAGIAAMVTGAAAQQYGASLQNKKANAVAQQALLQQSRQREDIQKKVLDAASQYEVPKTEQVLQETADELSQRYAQPVSEAQGIRASQQGTTGDVSDDYSVAKAKSDAEGLQYVQNLANLMGKVNASSRMRMNQGFNLAKVSQDIAQANKFNAMDNNLALMNVQAKANGTNGWNTGGGILQGLGSVLATYGAGAALAAPAASSGAAASGYGLSTTAGGTGVGSLAAKAGSTLGGTGGTSWLAALGGSAPGYGLSYRKNNRLI